MALKFPIFPKPSFSFDEAFIEKTLISQFENGAEQRRNKWSQGKKVFTINGRAFTKEETDRLWEFFQLCRGSFKEFAFLNPSEPTLPYDSVTCFLPIHEGEGTKIDDWNGFIYPSYKCRFMEDNLSREEFTARLYNMQIKLYQVSPIVFTNNYGTIAGAAWAECPDGSACLDFDGSDDQGSLGDASALDVGTGSFSFALGIYADSLASQLGILSKKTNDQSSTDGYHLVIGTNGQITVRVADGSAQNVIQSAVSAIPAQTWKIITVVINRAGQGQIYLNNVASGSPVSITATADADNSNIFYLGRAEGIAYGNCKLRNFLFSKKAWTQAERDKVWNAWKGIFQIT